MKKILLFSVLAAIAYASCKKDNAAVPTTCFSIGALDSSKAVLLDSVRLDSVIRTQAPGYFVDVTEGTPVSAYKRTLVFKNCGSAATYRVLYTGDSTHMKVDAANPGTAAGTQTAVDFSGGMYSYRYKAAGTYTVTVVSSNAADFGNDVQRSAVAKTFILK